MKTTLGAIERCSTCGTSLQVIVSGEGACNAQSMEGQILETVRELRVLLLWEAGEITEGRAMRLLGVDRLEARRIRKEVMDFAKIILAMD